MPKLTQSMRIKFSGAQMCQKLIMSWLGKSYRNHPQRTPKSKESSRLKDKAHPLSCLPMHHPSNWLPPSKTSKTSSAKMRKKNNRRRKVHSKPASKHLRADLSSNSQWSRNQLWWRCLQWKLLFSHLLGTRWKRMRNPSGHAFWASFSSGYDELWKLMIVFVN